jgi:hypothetical protein
MSSMIEHGRWTRLPFSRTGMLTGVAVLAFVVSGANAGAALNARAQASVSPFCGFASKYSKTSFSPTSSTASLEKDYSELKAVEPVMLSSAPSTLKPDLQKIFAFDNLIFTSLEKVNFNVLKLPHSFEETLAKDGAALAAVTGKLDAYFESSCGVKTN